MTNPLQIVIVSAGGSAPARFDASLGGRWLCRSKTPFLTSARALLEEGVPGDTIIEMHHAGAGHWSLRSLVGVAAGLAVRDDDSGTRFTKFKSFEVLA